MFFLLCLLMVPVATAELSTDNWIGQLMKPVMEDGWGVDARWAIIFSAGIMFLLRTFAGGILKIFSPPVLMAVSGILSASGLYWLGVNATGIAILAAFVIYAVGQTYYWPCILGFVAERYPKGGALTLNTVSAMGLLSLGMVGNPILGVAQDQSIHKQSQEKAPELAAVATSGSDFLWMTNDVIDPAKFAVYGAQKIDGKGEMLISALQPIIASNDELKEKKGEFDEEQKKILEAAQKKDPKASVDTDVAAIRLYDFVETATKEDDALTKSFKDSVPASVQTGIDDYKAMVGNHAEMKKQSGRDVLKFAAWFPSILVVSFTIIALYFKSRGGYRPAELDEA